MANRLACSQDTRVVPKIAEGFQKTTITCNNLFTDDPWPATAEKKAVHDGTSAEE